MNTQKIQMSTKSTRGFTLVELIVVITILVILGTIAFLNMGSFSASARDSRRTSDLNQINSQIMTIQAKSGLVYSNLVDTTSSGALTNASISGSGAGTAYSAGQLNYGPLGIDSAKFKDPTTNNFYKIGQTSLGGGAYELAATLEDNGKSALVMGIYRSRTVASTTSIGTVSTTTITLSTTPANFKVGDWIVGDTSGTGQISAISSDAKTLTLAASGPAGTVFSLAAPESVGLIAQSGSTTVPVTNGSAATLPY